MLNIAFGEPTLAVDTHVFRVANRTGLAPGRTVEAVEKKLGVRPDQVVELMALTGDKVDNGPGVPEAIRAFVFEPFFTTKPRGRGTGLGLSLVHATAAAHGGSVRVEDAPGGGARFTIELPAD